MIYFLRKLTKLKKKRTGTTVINLNFLIEKIAKTVKFLRKKIFIPTCAVKNNLHNIHFDIILHA